MFKGRDVIGKYIVAYDTGEKFDVIEDLIFEEEAHQLLGFLVQEAGWFKKAYVVMFSDIKAIGADAVISTSREFRALASEMPTISPILEHNTSLNGTRILTMDGRDLGSIVDIYFDETSGNVMGYEVSGGLFADAYSGRSFVPAVNTLKVGRDVAFVPTATAKLMEEQVGGFRGAMQVVSDRVQEGAHITGDKLNELGHTASDNFQRVSHQTGDKLHDLGQSASDTFQKTSQFTSDKLNELGRATAEDPQSTGHTSSNSLSKAVVDAEAQKAFVVGKFLERDVITPGGSSLVMPGQPITPEIANTAESLGILDDLYQAAGGNWSTPMGTKLSAAIAGLTVEQAEGRRVKTMVRNEAGSIVAAPGQIVTPEMIERARNEHREHVLLQAVGLSAGDALRESANNAVTAAGDRTASAGEQIRSSAQELWSQAKDITSNLQYRSSRAIEDQKIKGALGRPVVRVIFDKEDAVILNVGELITHQAISRARQAEVLDQLLSSVYTEKPLLSLDDMRAPQAGTTAL